MQAHIDGSQLLWFGDRAIHTNRSFADIQFCFQRERLIHILQGQQGAGFAVTGNTCAIESTGDFPAHHKVVNGGWFQAIDVGFCIDVFDLIFKSDLAAIKI
ncbi:hypothetical protein D3C81_1526120 [compost metagenome]